MKTEWFLSKFKNKSAAAAALGVYPSNITRWPESIPDSDVGRIARMMPDVMLEHLALTMNQRQFRNVMKKVKSEAQAPE